MTTNADQPTLPPEHIGPRSAWSRYDWMAPLVSLTYLLYLLLRDAVLIVGLIGISHAVEHLLDLIDGGWAPVIAGYTVTSAKIVSGGDHGLLIAFILLQICNIVRVAIRNDH